MKIDNGKKDSIIEWNPVDIVFTLIVDILAAISFSVSVTAGGIKSVVVLFGITYLYSFYEERKKYSGILGKKQELSLTNWGCIISILILTACVMVGIGAAEIGVQGIENPKIILESGSGSIFHWSSIRITYLLFIVLLYPSFIHIALGVVAYLRTQEINVEDVKKYIKRTWYCEFFYALICAIIGGIVCYLKYVYIHNTEDIRYPGEPQYYKYCFLCGFIGLIIGWYRQGKKNIEEQKRKNSINAKEVAELVNVKAEKRI